MIRLIHLMMHMLGTGDKMITRTLASNNADHGTHADQGCYTRRTKQPFNNEANGIDDEGNHRLIPGKVNEIFSKMGEIDSGDHPASIVWGGGFRR